MEIVATLADARCPIRFVEALALNGALPEDSVIVTDHNVRGCWPNVFPGRPTVAVPPGEGSKSIAVYRDVLEALAAAGAHRGTTVVAFGGGVIGDLAGFAAATYMRGVPLIQVPTSLLAMVDSSVGGKVGVDLEAGKNLAGAFLAPMTVLVATELLGTLPERQWRNGMAEVVKYGFIMDAPLLERLNQSADELAAHCIRLKVRVVDEDPYERTGARAILNFGHTVGHAIERLTGYGSVLHGEAVGMGMVVEARLAEVLGHAELGLAHYVAKVLTRVGLPTSLPPELSARHSELVEAMRGDKKSRRGELGFSLVSQPGRCTLLQNVPEEAVLRALSDS